MIDLVTAGGRRRELLVWGFPDLLWQACVSPLTCCSDRRLPQRPASL